MEVAEKFFMVARQFRRTGRSGEARLHKNPAGAPVRKAEQVRHPGTHFGEFAQFLECGRFGTNAGRGFWTQGELDVSENFTHGRHRLNRQFLASSRKADGNGESRPRLL